MKAILRASTAVFFLVASLAFARADDAKHNFAKWEHAIAAFEQSDATNPPPKGAYVFIGSSTVARWKSLVEDFPALKVINRGFGGSEIVDATHFAARAIYPYAPKVVVLRAGGNDLWAGNPVDKVFGDFKDFCESVHAQLPDAKIVFLSLSPSVARWSQHEKEKALNTLAEHYMQGKPFCNTSRLTTCRSARTASRARSCSWRTSCTSTRTATNCSPRASGRNWRNN